MYVRSTEFTVRSLGFDRTVMALYMPAFHVDMVNVTAFPVLDAINPKHCRTQTVYLLPMLAGLEGVMVGNAGVVCVLLRCNT